MVEEVVNSHDEEFVVWRTSFQRVPDIDSIGIISESYRSGVRALKRMHESAGDRECLVIEKMVGGGWSPAGDTALECHVKFGELQ